MWSRSGSNGYPITLVGKKRKYNVLYRLEIGFGRTEPINYVLITFFGQTFQTDVGKTLLKRFRDLFKKRYLENVFQTLFKRFYLRRP